MRHSQGTVGASSSRGLESCKGAKDSQDILNDGNSQESPSASTPLLSRSQRGRHHRTSSGLRLDTSLIVRTNNGSSTSMRVKLPLLGGFYFSDIVVIVWSLACNMIKSCTLAELLDLFYFVAMYHITSLASDMRLRVREYGLSVFQAYMLSVMRMVMHTAPYIPSRVLLSQETIAPFLRWRTGSAASRMIRAYGDVKSQGFQAYWIHGDSRLPPPTPMRERIVVLFVHGGGFALGSVALYAEPLLRIMSHTATFNKQATVQCVALEYGLVPNTRFPSPLIEALRCYAHLIEHERIPSSHIVLAGDSAGGNLVMSMLLCLDGQGMSRVGGRNWSALPLPARAVLISPWVDLRPSCTQTMKSTSVLDILSPACLTQFAQMYTRILPRPRRVAGPGSKCLQRLSRSPSFMAAWIRTWLAQPPILGTRAVNAVDARNDSVSDAHQLYDTTSTNHAISHMAVSPTMGQWQQISLRCGLFVLWGANEIMAEDIAAWTRRLPRVDSYVEKGGSGVHVWPFINALLAPTIVEREKGLSQIARAILNMPLTPSATEPVSPPSSMPSDSDESDNDQAQRAWEAELKRMFEQPMR